MLARKKCCGLKEVAQCVTKTSLNLTGGSTTRKTNKDITGGRTKLRQIGGEISLKQAKEDGNGREEEKF